MSPPFLVVCGPCNLDVLLRVKDLPQAGQSSPVIARRVLRGGNGGNIAAHAAGLGVATRLWSRVGTDFPPDWRADLQRWGVDARLAVIGDTTPTCFVFTDLVDRQAFAIDSGRSAQEPIGPEESLIEDVAPGGWLHLCTGDPLLYASIAASARLRGLHVALDPGQELSFQYDAATLRGMLSLAHLLMLNEDELRVAVSLLGVSRAEDLLAFVPQVIITRGVHGASLYRVGQVALHAPAFPVDRLTDPTGAGDAFRAGWYAALQRGEDLPQALRWAQAAGAAKVRHHGGQEHQLTWDDLKGFLA